MSSLFRVNITLADNEDLSKAFELTDATGTPADLTGADLRMDLENLDGATALALSLQNNRISMLDASNGRFELAVTALELQTLPPGVYRHDLLLTRDGRTQRIWEGTLVLVQGVTG